MRGDAVSEVAWVVGTPFRRCYEEVKTEQQFSLETSHRSGWFTAKNDSSETAGSRQKPHTSETAGSKKKYYIRKDFLR